MWTRHSPDKDAFRRWLENVKGFSAGSASDVASRCQRVERVLQQDLTALDPAQSVLQLREQLSNTESDVSRVEKTASDLGRALRLYFEFSRSGRS